MSTKKNYAVIDEEVEETKKLLDSMSEEIKSVSNKQIMIMDLMGEIKEVKRQNAKKETQQTWGTTTT